MTLGFVWLDEIISILLTMNKHHLDSLLLRFVLHMPNIIKLKLHNNWSAQALNNIECYVKFKQTNQICSHLKINQSTLNEAHVIEITKACTVTFMKARNPLVFQWRGGRVNWEKNKKVKIYFLKLHLIDFG